METSFTRVKDVNKLILEATDDKTLLNLLSVNKNFIHLGEQAFEKRMFSRYPKLANKKPYNISWHRWYLSNIYFINKLKEDFDFDYLPNSTLDPVIIFYVLNREKGTFEYEISKRNFYLESIVEEGNRDKIISIYTGDNIFDILKFLLKYKNIPLFDYLKNLHEKKYGSLDLEDSEIMFGAGQSGDKNVVDYALKLYKSFPRYDETDTFEEGERGAASVGDMDMLIYFQELFPHESIDLDEIIESAALNGKINFIKNFIVPENRKTLLNILPRIISYLLNTTSNTTKETLIETLKFLLNTYLSLGGAIKQINEFFRDRKIKKLEDEEVKILLKKYGIRY